MIASRKRNALGLLKGPGRTSKEGDDLSLKVITHIEALEGTPESEISKSLITKILMKEPRDAVDRLHTAYVKTKRDHVKDLTLTREKVISSKKAFTSTKEVDDFARHLEFTAKKDVEAIFTARSSLLYFNNLLDFYEIQNRPNNYTQANIFEKAYASIVNEETGIIGAALDVLELENSGDFEPGSHGYAVDEDVLDDVTIECN